MRALTIALLLLASGCVQQRSPAPQHVQDVSAQDAPADKAILYSDRERATSDSTLQRLDCLLGGAAYASEHRWSALDTTRFFGKRYLKYGPPRNHDLAYINQYLYRTGTHADGQVAVYTPRNRDDDLEPPLTLFVPVGPGCLIQAYQRPVACQRRCVPLEPE
jgi:hypothetical protein